MPRITDLSNKTYVAIVQCDIVTQRCPGFFCERSFSQREEGFATLPLEPLRRFVQLTCGGCCGRALHRKLSLLVKTAQKQAGVSSQQIVVTFASCITRDNYHAPPCPHLDYLVQLVEKLGLDYSFDTHLSAKAEARRAAGVYRQPKPRTS